MSNNLIIINAHIVTPQGRTARKGEAMNELLNIPCGTVRVTDGIITYVGENRISHEKPGYKVNPEKPDVPLNKNDAFQKVQKRRVQEKR
mgnify:CR=1 FL=1